MTAHPNQHSVLTRRDLHLRDARTAAATLIAVAAWAYAAATLAVPEPQPHVDPRIERILRAACRLPTNDGEATTYAVADGKIYCWRMK